LQYCRDISGRNNDGVAVGTTIGNTPYGGFRERIFNGVSDYVSCGDVGEVEGLTALTVAAWIRPIVTNAYQDCVMKAGVFELHTFTGNFIYFAVFIPGVGWRTATYAGISPYNRYHTVGVYDSSTVQVYVNGVKGAVEPAATGRIATTANPVMIGSTGVANWFNGSISEVQIITRALSEDAIIALFNSSRRIYGA
jgi:hypothetical protein